MVFLINSPQNHIITVSCGIKRVYIIFCLIFIAGLPPSPLIFIKIRVLTEIIKLEGIFLSRLILIVFSGINIFIYANAFTFIILGGANTRVIQKDYNLDLLDTVIITISGGLILLRFSIIYYIW